MRFFTPEQQLVPLPEEAAQQETSQAERLAAKLRELGVNPDTI